MRLGGPVRQVVTLHSANELHELVKRCRAEHTPFFVLGDGSNVIARDEGFDGVIILNRIKSFDIVSEENEAVTIRIGAGENWDSVVERSVELGLSGIEAMSAIPGTAGATPVQNVGAYGQEIADTLVELEAYDTDSLSFITLTNSDCHFSYRSSIFKDPARRHHIITSITLRLTRRPMQPPFYASLQSYLDSHHLSDTSPATIRDAVKSIRKDKLPDPKRIANTGSFFKNPIVPDAVAQKLKAQYADLPIFPLKNNTSKLAAGWLIEHCGLKGYSSHGMKTYENNALVLVNVDATSYKDLLSFRDEIIKKVRDTFEVTLEQEPETL